MGYWQCLTVLLINTAYRLFGWCFLIGYSIYCVPELSAKWPWCRTASCEHWRASHCSSDFAAQHAKKRNMKRSIPQLRYKNRIAWKRPVLTNLLNVVRALVHPSLEIKCDNFKIKIFLFVIILIEAFVGFFPIFSICTLKGRISKADVRSSTENASYQLNGNCFKLLKCRLPEQRSNSNRNFAEISFARHSSKHCDNKFGRWIVKCSRVSQEWTEGEFSLAWLIPTRIIRQNASAIS